MKKVLILLFLLLLVNPVKAITYKELKNTEQPVVLYLYSPYCSACKSYSPLFEQLRKAYVGSNLKFVKENISKNPELGYILSVDAVPAIYVIKNTTAYKIDYDCTWDVVCISEILDSYK